MLRQYRMFAAYNRWANAQLYAAAAALSDAEFRSDRGAFFGSLHRTLNHLMVADRIWMKRFTGIGEAPTTLDAVLFEEFDALAAARRTEDERIIAWTGTLDEATLAGNFTYMPVTQQIAMTQPLWTALSHLFNHQTHHRGQCHMTLTALGKPSLGLDLIYFLRSEGREWM
ncbi:DinB family DNA damage-inducible protein [Rhizobium phaseoli]|uniref:Damage-inducible protein DinB n=1 Tax=Rhizobium phaseoli TaxID=396 RepID=A0A192T8U3_9HYPH|nr:MULTISPECIES: DinB family protein [Rhizobium]MDH6650463.1 putative damage-inducible protein DinB [Rhizobium esperanzae]ANL39950.1 DinB family DNA damage-inducible protein [Rhizobium phaseoli]ANL52653.1 DinB family DNA damage-inducible protein [Rhizobium phaseoli]ANL58939.1 DinB family DNA damage-inducible protein [Rhizobium phaseoli]ANL65202.1 DinB family DNA damage-inducible protein [Rhizobium phaseoli]